MPRGIRKSASDSTAEAVKSFERAENVLPVPDGYGSDSDEFRVIWTAFTRARPADSWRSFDLILLARAADLEVDIRRQKKAINEEGYVVVNNRGTQIENPRIRTWDTMVRQQLAVIRSLSLNQTASDPRTLNRQGKEDEKAVELIKGEGAKSLLARPN